MSKERGAGKHYLSELPEDHPSEEFILSTHTHTHTHKCTNLRVALWHARDCSQHVSDILINDLERAVGKWASG